MRLLGWMAGLALLVVATWWWLGDGLLRRFQLGGSIEILEQAGGWAWAVGLGLLLADLFLPVPGTMVISALGWVYGFWVGGLVAATGLMLAGVAGYGVGRLLGEKWGRKWLGEPDWQRGQKLFAQGGGWVVAISRGLPILPEVISCTAGLVRMPFRRFVMSLACGCLPMGFLFAAIGNVGHAAPWWAVAWSLTIPAALWFLADRLQRRNIGS